MIALRGSQLRDDVRIILEKRFAPGLPPGENPGPLHPACPPMQRPSCALLLAVCCPLLQAESVTLTVISTADSGAGSLRDAISAAANGDVITFDASLAGQTITLTSGPLVVDNLETTIEAPSLAAGPRLDGNQASRVFSVLNGASLTLSNLLLEDGREISGNGGGIFVENATLVMSGCVLQNCYSQYNGGGAYLGNGTTASIDRTLIAGNESNSFGGGLFLIGTVSAELTNSSVQGNRAQFAGGMLNFADAPSITNCTIQGNSGAGIRNENSSAPVIRNTIVWGNRTASGSLASQQIKNAAGASPDVDYSLVEGAPASANNLDGTAPANAPQFVVAEPAASAPTTSSDLRSLAGSASFDVGLNAANSSPADLAGKTRIQGGTIDLGAFEGPYVTFASLHPALSPLGDENGNSLSNFHEYALGVDPSGSVEAALDNLPTVESDGGQPKLVLFRRPDGADVSALWEYSHDGVGWSSLQWGVDYSAAQETVTPGGLHRTELSLTSSEPYCLYRQGFTGG